jgi:hypothetical protein
MNDCLEKSFKSVAQASRLCFRRYGPPTPGGQCPLHIFLLREDYYPLTLTLSPIGGEGKK